jgi:enediyne polyketide synthase
MGNRGDQGGPVAIIGVAGRFPGAAEPAEFHDLTVAGRRMFRPVAGTPGGPLHAALLDDWVRPGPSGDLGVQDFGPVQKLAAETTALALADAGFREVGGRGLLRDADGRCGRAGLFLASSMAGVGSLVREQFGFAADAAEPGTAATSSLHAVVAAAAALGAGDLDLAVAGGVELGLDPAWLTAQARAGTLGRDEMRVYAADPAGLLPGEGCGVVVLARSADAKAAELPVYAEIAGWSTVPVSPSALDPQALLRAYTEAGIDPADIQLIEGEGTGTAFGDLAELIAFAQLRQSCRATAALGAVAAGIGYTRAAAGIASLVKTALAMAAGMIPPGTECARQHPLIESGDALLRLPRRPEPWPDGSVGTSGTRLAAVNSLGTADPAAGPDLYGLRQAEGVHLVLGREAEADRGRGRRRRTTATATATAATAGVASAGVASATAATAGTAPTIAVVPAAPAAPAVVVTSAAAAASVAPAVQVESSRQPSVFALCGRDPGMLANRLEVIAEAAPVLSAAELRELARDLAAGVLRMADRAGCGQASPEDSGLVRVALTAATPTELAARARSAARRLRAGVAGAARAAGAGVAGTAGMAGMADVADTAGDPGVRVSVGAAGRVVVVFGGLAGLVGVCGPGLDQSARLAASLAALRTLDSFGVIPGTAVGYSLGEITGLVWAGCLPAAEAARLVAQCGQVLRGCACGPAAMARVAADAVTVRRLGAPDRLHIAAYESARSHVLAGPTAGIRNLTRRAAAAGVTVEVLGTTHALHSPAMARCAAPLRSVLSGTRFAPPRRRLISTITGRPVTPGDDVAELLAGQLSRPVLFGPAMALAAERADLVVVAGPDDGLARLAAASAAVPCVAVAGGPTQGDPAAAARVVAALFAAGAIGGLAGLDPAGTSLAGLDLAGTGSGPGPGGVRAGQFVPRMRDGEATEARTTIRSV